MGLKLLKKALIKKGMLKPKKKPSKKWGIFEVIKNWENIEEWENIENIERKKGMPRKMSLTRFPHSNGGLVKYKNVSKIK